MGEHQISEVQDSQEMRGFVKALLEDLRALDRMLEEGIIESGVRRIGAEQEMVLADSAFRPAMKAPEILKRLGDARFAPELGKFNLEANLAPRVYQGDCLSRLEEELRELVTMARQAAQAEGSRLILCGILPTLEKADLSLDSMTPQPRYHQLNRTMVGLRGGEFRTLIKGLDELQITHDNVMLEACNTSFQIHFQVGADEFVHLYNLAQAVTAPVLAAAVNSPVMLQQRLWMETRVALFQQSLDVRSEAHTQRGGRKRVSFGSDWVRESAVEIFREDVARFRALISMDVEESSMAMLDAGQVPPLRALCLHNGTVYRWNRPCYGVKDGVAHLRIENRVLPAGPTIVDQMANAAFYFGLMSSLGEEYPDITRVMAFDDAKANFMAAARYGLDAGLRWIGGDKFAADELILKHLLPMAHRGLERHEVPGRDIDRYLGVLEARVASRRTGAQWALDSLARMSEQATASERCRALTAAMAANQEREQPVHTWENASMHGDYAVPDSYRKVAQVMTRDLFTVHPEDVVDLAASLMDWEHIRHVPVEDNEGRLVGLLSHRRLLRILAGLGKDPRPVAVREVMKTNPVTIAPETSCLEAIELMRSNRVGCLPVVDGAKLVGIVTEKDFIQLAGGLLENWLKGG